MTKGKNGASICQGVMQAIHATRKLNPVLPSYVPVKLYDPLSNVKNTSSESLISSIFKGIKCQNNDV